MSENDWIILCALVLEKEKGFDAAMEFMMVVCREKPIRLTHPSFFWWANKYAADCVVYISRRAAK